MIDLPEFIPTNKESSWIASHRDTARLLKNLWGAASRIQRRDPDFLSALLRATWVGSHHPTDRTRLTRNRYFARWLGIPENSAAQELEIALCQRLPRLKRSVGREFVRTSTGVTLYYGAARPATVRLVRVHRAIVGRAFELVSQTHQSVEDKVYEVAELLGTIPRISMPNGGTMSPYNGLSPALACLDPQGAFPIINKQTRTLLSALSVHADSEGAVAMSKLIGRQNVSDNAALDVFANTRIDEIKRAVAQASLQKPLPRASSTKLTLLGEKSETTGIASIAKKRVLVRKLHNQLTNQFRRAIVWRHKPVQSRCDVILRRWSHDRWLLIEAKTGTAGLGGRTQLRQAIGQLFDYRMLQFGSQAKSVDLALLTPTKPEPDVLFLLESLGIEALWFAGKRLEGTIDLLS
jgi:hypothetical protein